MLKKLEFVFIVCMLALVACSCKNKAACSAIQPYVDTAASAVAGALSCSNPQAFDADVMSYISSNNLCTLPSPTPSTGEKGAIAALVCPIVVPAVMALASNTQILKDGGCTLAAAESLAETACLAAPF